jgi:membrane protein required for colicin V production
MGLFDGFVKQVISFIALIASIFFAGKIAIPMRGFLLNHFSVDSISPDILTGLCYLLAFILIILAISLVGKLIDVAIKMTPAKPLNMLLGGVFGFCIWIFSLSIFFNIFAVLDSNSQIISKQTQEKSVFYTKIKGVVPMAYPFLKKYFNYPVL